MASSCEAIPCGVEPENKTFRRRRYEKRQASLRCCGIETATEQVNSGSFCRGRFFGRFDMNMRQAPFTLQLSQVVNRVFLSV
jgi:hypothetical protein